MAWCVGAKVDPWHPSEVDLANHLAFLSSSLKLSAAALAVRRSAVSTTLAQCGFSLPTSSRIVSDVLRGARSLQASRRFRVPSWDLFLVLAFLRGPPFEPLYHATFADLSVKTLLLTVLASGRRMSEVHALSGLAADFAVEPDGSVTLRFLPEFVAKNQNPLDPSPVVSIRRLSDVISASEPDCLNCPVRALSRYVRFASNLRVSQRRLFISVNNDYHKDISKSTLSRWVSGLIRRAYQSPLVQNSGGGPMGVPLVKATAHEVRAWASTLAVTQTSATLEAVLDAAYWRSPDVFIGHYLRDVQRVRADGRFGVRSAVVAQQVMSAAR